MIIALILFVSETLYFFGDNNFTEWHALFDEYNAPPYKIPYTSPAYSFGIAGTYCVDSHCFLASTCAILLLLLSPLFFAVMISTAAPFLSYSLSQAQVQVFPSTGTDQAIPRSFMAER